MADGYEYDVFISAASESPVEEWVSNHFVGMLKIHLGNEMPRAPKVFWYKEQETGVDWVKNLQRILPRSSILIAVLSPHYFRSKWCMAEFESMQSREKQLGMATVEYPKGLIYPVLFSDGDWFNEVARVKYRKDLSEWRYHWPQFRNSLKYLEFDKAMREVAKELAKQFAAVPPWSADFPVITDPTTLREAKMELPRI